MCLREGERERNHVITSRAGDAYIQHTQGGLAYLLLSFEQRTPLRGTKGTSYITRSCITDHADLSLPGETPKIIGSAADKPSHMTD